MNMQRMIQNIGFLIVIYKISLNICLIPVWSKQHIDSQRHKDTTLILLVFVLNITCNINRTGSTFISLAIQWTKSEEIWSNLVYFTMFLA